MRVQSMFISLMPDLFLCSILCMFDPCIRLHHDELQPSRPTAAPFAPDTEALEPTPPWASCGLLIEARGGRHEQAILNPLLTDGHW